MEELKGNNRILANEIYWMEQRLEDLETRVEGLTLREEKSLATRDKICTEMQASNDFSNIQLALDVRMAKCI